MKIQETFFTRVKDHSRKILVLGETLNSRRKSYVLLEQEGRREFKSQKELLKYVTGGKSYRDLKTYLGNRSKTQKRKEESILDWFQVPAEPVVMKKGIDLGVKHNDVRRLLWKQYGMDITRNGYDFEEVLQQVYLGLEIRNNGTCPFDESKSSFSHYVYMVSACVYKNWKRKRSKYHFEQLGMWDSTDKTYKDVRQCNVGSVGLDAEKQRVEYREVIEDFFNRLKERAAGLVSIDTLRAILENVVVGEKKKDLPALVGVSPSIVTKVTRIMRELAREVYA